ncbi:uncharacterized protein HHUB_2166 [Halobacterium hubeiense]|uniref:Uncharacterized protein n=1 Tax=Halobacterium hubeiense TaxID=1407499 RepID=A0A0U5GZU9_9EURY|nr:uncharacterized protein HHUB_2166 [Halobacterium hubeiense]
MRRTVEQTAIVVTARCSLPRKAFTQTKGSQRQKDTENPWKASRYLREKLKRFKVVLDGQTRGVTSKDGSKPCSLRHPELLAAKFPLLAYFQRSGASSAHEHREPTTRWSGTRQDVLNQLSAIGKTLDGTHAHQTRNELTSKRWVYPNLLMAGNPTK